MIGDPEFPGNKPSGIAANDNADHSPLDVDTLDSAVYSLARLFGRQIARQHFAAIRADNDNNEAPKNTDS